jgi:hypothetical protein
MTDVADRPSIGVWFITVEHGLLPFVTFQWGCREIPVPAMMATASMDVAVWSSNGFWFTKQSSTASATQWG